VSARSSPETWTSLVTCPEGHDFWQWFFDRATLSLRLREGGPIPLYCPACSLHRDATVDDRNVLDRALHNAR